MLRSGTSVEIVVAPICLLWQLIALALDCPKIRLCEMTYTSTNRIDANTQFEMSKISILFDSKPRSSFRDAEHERTA